MFKKILISLSLIGLIIFSSCSNLIEPKTDTDISFTLGDRAAAEISKAAVTKDSEFIITCTFEGIKLPAKTVTVTKATLANAKITLENVPFNKEFKILLDVSYNGHVIYEGESNPITLNQDNDGLGVNIKINKRKGKISYNKNEGTTVEKEQPVVFVEEYFIDTAAVALPEMEKEGCYFWGWYSDKSCEEKYKVTELGKENYIGDVTLYAKFTSLLVNIIPEDGIVDMGDEITLSTGTKDAVINYSIDLISHQVNNSFNGNGKIKVDSSLLTDTNKFKITAYSEFKGMKTNPVSKEFTINTYNVTFNNNGYGTAPSKITGKYKGYKLTASDLAIDDTNLGVTFNGWKDASKGIIAADNELTSSLILVAQWIDDNPSKITDFVVTPNINSCSVTCKWTNPTVGDFDKVVITYTDIDSNLKMVTKEVAISSTEAGYDKGATCSKTINVSDGFSGKFGITVYDKGKNKSETAYSINVGINTHNLTVIPEKIKTETFGSKTCDIVKFGDWPQTNVVADTVSTVAPVKINGWECYKGKNDDFYYVRIMAPETKNGFTKGQPYYFKLEPIEWIVLTDNYNGKKLLFSRKIIDMKEWFNYTDSLRQIGGKDIYNNNYEHSQIRAYLNGYDFTKSDDSIESKFKDKGFLQQAFVPFSQGLIAFTDVDNSPKSTFSYDYTENIENKNACKNTKDRVFLLSNQEITNPDYGYSNENRWLIDKITNNLFTDYTKLMGIDTSNIWWWLRSPEYRDGSMVSNISQYKQIATVQNKWVAGVVPAIVVDAIEEPIP